MVTEKKEEAKVTPTVEEKTSTKKEEKAKTEVVMKPAKEKAIVKEEKPKAEKKEAKPPVKEEAKDEVKPKGTDKKPGEKEASDEKKIIKESVHIIPLRKAFEHPRTSRARYAVREIKEYIKKHTRKDGFVDPSVNEALWTRGIQKPPRRIKVKIQEEEDKATAVLV